MVNRLKRPRRSLRGTITAGRVRVDEARDRLRDRPSSALFWGSTALWWSSRPEPASAPLFSFSCECCDSEFCERIDNDAFERARCCLVCSSKDSRPGAESASGAMAQGFFFWPVQPLKLRATEEAARPVRHGTAGGTAGVGMSQRLCQEACLLSRSGTRLEKGKTHAIWHKLVMTGQKFSDGDDAPRQDHSPQSFYGEGLLELLIVWWTSPAHFQLFSCETRCPLGAGCFTRSLSMEYGARADQRRAIRRGLWK